ncbi:MAG: sulfatase [Phycisphaerae bacterium]
MSLALAAGLLEATLAIALRSYTPTRTWNMLVADVTPDFVWAAPLTYAVLAALSGTVMHVAFGLAARWSRLTKEHRASAAVLLLTALAVYPLIRVTDRLHWWAALLLAIGVAWRVLAALRGRLAPVFLYSRHAAPLLAALVAAIWALRSWPNPSAAHARVVSRADCTNVLLVVLDTCRADHLSAYGYARPTTPRLDALARQGALFESAYASSCWTPASHGTLFTSRWVREHGADGPRPQLAARWPTLAEHLRAAGYATAAFIANSFWVTSRDGFDRGFEHFEDFTAADMIVRTVYGKVIVPHLPSIGLRGEFWRKNADDVNRSFLDWLDHQSKRPFFAFLNYMDIHGPYVTPNEHHTLYMDDAQRETQSSLDFEPPVQGSASSPRAAILAAAYDGALTYLDDRLGELFDSLQQRGILDNTLVIVTSDHGDAFGEHGLFRHGHSLSQELTHVPLIARLPGRIESGQHYKRATGLHDVAATICAAVLPGRPHPFQGVSFLDGSDDQPSRPILQEVARRPGVFPSWPVSRADGAGVYAAPWHLIEYGSDRVELYDTSTDPQERHNLATDDAGREILPRLDALIDQMQDREQVVAN